MKYDSPGSLVLLFALLVVTGFAVGGLLGYVEPVVGAAVGIGAQVVGTVAFFVAYAIGSRNEAREARTPGDGDGRALRIRIARLEEKEPRG